MKTGRCHTLSDAETLYTTVTNRVLTLAQNAIKARGHFHLALAGGQTPQKLYERLAECTDVDWSRWEIWFGDERCVPPDHHDSNYLMARKKLLEHVPIPENQIHPIIKTSAFNSERAAIEYADALTALLPSHAGWPLLDTVLLGVGPDGHTASLFPGTPILDIADTPVAPVHVPRLGAWRISLTLPVLRYARHLLFIVEGSGKSEILNRLMHGPSTKESLLPVERISNPHTEWYLDAAAKGCA